MTELIKLILINPTVILLLVILVFGKKFIEYFFSKTIEFKKLELSQELENHKLLLNQRNKDFQHTLDLKLNEFNIQFSKLHQDRAEVIRVLYQKIIELQTAMTIFTQMLKPIIENAENEEELRLHRVNNALQDFVNYFSPNKIYFNKSLTAKLDSLLKEYNENGWNYARMNKAFDNPKLPHDIFVEYADKTTEISKLVKEKFPQIIEDLEDEFRKILGVTVN